MKPRTSSNTKFPYHGLRYAEDVTRNLIEEHGGEAEIKMFAHTVGHQTSQSGAFQMKVNSAKHFGLIKKKGALITATELAFDLTNPALTANARILAFFNVPLYADVFNYFLGKPVPSVDRVSILLIDLGVVPGQTRRAAKAFISSLRDAKLVNEEFGVLYRPLFGSTSASASDAQAENSDGIHPAIDPLLRLIPSKDASWTKAEIDSWCDAIRNVLYLVFAVGTSSGKVSNNR